MRTAHLQLHTFCTTDKLTMGQTIATRTCNRSSHHAGYWNLLQKKFLDCSPFYRSPGTKTATLGSRSQHKRRPRIICDYDLTDSTKISSGRPTWSHMSKDSATAIRLCSEPQRITTKELPGNAFFTATKMIFHYLLNISTKFQKKYYAESIDRFLSRNCPEQRFVKTVIVVDITNSTFDEAANIQLSPRLPMPYCGQPISSTSLKTFLSVQHGCKYGRQHW
jgi:hypothetical protein